MQPLDGLAVRDRGAMAWILQEGTVFAGRYRVVRRIAAGAMGAVVALSRARGRAMAR